MSLYTITAALPLDHGCRWRSRINNCHSKMRVPGGAPSEFGNQFNPIPTGRGQIMPSTLLWVSAPLPDPKSYLHQADLSLTGSTRTFIQCSVLYLIPWRSDFITYLKNQRSLEVVLNFATVICVFEHIKGQHNLFLTGKTTLTLQLKNCTVTTKVAFMANIDHLNLG